MRTVTLSTLLALSLGGASCTSLASAPDRPPARTTVADDGVALAWEERGAGEPALVFVHGWCGDRGVWDTTLEALSSSHRVIALDLAGHGASGAGREDWTLDSLAEDVVTVVEASEAGRVILVGHSMGATVALLAAPRLAPRVAGIVAVDSLHDADFAYPPGFLEEAAAALEEDFARALEASYRSAVRDPREERLVDWLLQRAGRTDRRAAIGLLRGLEGFELAPALAAAGVPVRAINAAPGAARPATRVERNRELADYDVVLLEGVGHFPMLEDPPAFRAALRAQVAGLARPATVQDR